MARRGRGTGNQTAPGNREISSCIDNNDDRGDESSLIMMQMMISELFLIELFFLDALASLRSMLAIH